MFKRIIVPLDGSAFAEAALAPACTLARAFGAHVLLVRAYGREGLPYVMPPDVEMEAEELDSADGYLAALTERIKQAGYRAERVLYVAEPGTAISDAAVLDDADVIVMTTHPRWRVDLLDNASTTLRVLARSRVPVLSWKRGSGAVGGRLLDPLAEPVQFLGPESPIVVPLDGSPFSEAALRPAQELAAAFGTYLVLTRAVARVPVAATPGAHPDAATQSANLAVGDAHRYLERVLANLERTGANAAIEVAVGGVVHALDEAWRKTNAGLVVMSSHGQTATPTSFLGSNAAQVLEELTLPVLVIRP